MDDSKIIAATLILISLVGLYLTQQNKINQVIQVVTDPTTQPNVTTKTTLGEYVGGFLVYLLVLSFLDQQSGIWLTIALVLGGLMYNSSKSQDGGLIKELTTPIGTQ